MKEDEEGEEEVVEEESRYRPIIDAALAILMVDFSNFPQIR